ncbi:MAG: hypothetical protein WC277_04135 [Bacilli bacterium]|jgi:hypothetical protein
MPLPVTQNTPWSPLDLANRIEQIEDGLVQLTYRTGRKCVRQEVPDIDDPGTLMIVRYIDQSTEQPVAEYEVRDDPPRIIVRMRGGA